MQTKPHKTFIPSTADFLGLLLLAIGLLFIIGCSSAGAGAVGGEAGARGQPRSQGSSTAPARVPSPSPEAYCTTQVTEDIEVTEHHLTSYSPESLEEDLEFLNEQVAEGTAFFISSVHKKSEGADAYQIEVPESATSWWTVLLPRSILSSDCSQEELHHQPVYFLYKELVLYEDESKQTPVCKFAAGSELPLNALRTSGIGELMVDEPLPECPQVEPDRGYPASTFLGLPAHVVIPREG